MEPTTPTTDPRLLRLAPEDNVATATATLHSGQSITLGGQSVVLSEDIPTGHKLALAPIAAGRKVVKYGLPIGSATAPIHPGDRVHTHNLKSDYLPTYTFDDDRRFLETGKDT